MFRTVDVPLWLAVLAAFLSAWALLDRLLVPGVRWAIRRRAEAALDAAQARLRIPIQPFKLTKREVLIDRLTYDPQVLEAAEASIGEEGVPREVVMARIASFAREIVPAFNAYVYFRVGYALARGIARSLFRVRVGSAEGAALARIPGDATVVFVINHRSNMDYILVSYLVAENAALSYAVGEWARIFPLQALFRAMGAFFVRRDSKNPLYRKVLERYVAMAVQGGVTQAVFPEGGLSRDGGIRPPKLGLIDYMLRAFDPGAGRDLVFVPVGLNLDRTLEDRTLLRDLEPDIPRKGLLSAAATTLRFLGHHALLLASNRWHRFGYACVDFGAPVSLRGWLSGRSADPRHLPRQERIALAGDLARDLMEAVARVIPVVPVPLVASVCAGEPEKVWSEIELKAEALARMRALEAAGARVYVPRRDADYAVSFGLKALRLRRLVLEEEGFLRANPAELPLLGYYAESIAHLGGAGPHPGKASDSPARG
jgi:glycerol-3-phosphate O-acyltransferase